MPTRAEKRRRRRERRRRKRENRQALARLGITGRVLVGEFRMADVTGVVDLGRNANLTVWGLPVHADYLLPTVRRKRR